MWSYSSVRSLYIKSKYEYGAFLSKWVPTTADPQAEKDKVL